jgi:hypothetical protein
MRECLIIGNGPSRNELPAAQLIELESFGMNYCDFTPTYYVAIDTDVLTTGQAAIIERARQAKIIYLSALHAGSSAIYALPQVQLVAKDERSFKAEQYLSGFTASYVALKLAYYAGFERVHLWGVDHSPGWEHYRADYPAGATTPDRMRVMEWHYQLAATIYARARREIINHSHASRLDMIFRRANG